MDDRVNPTDFETLRQHLKRDEGLRLLPYVDIVGKITIGYGRNLSDNGITQLDADAMLTQDMERHVSDLLLTFPVVATLDSTRQIVLGNMAFNMGLVKLLGFTTMWRHLTAHEYTATAEAMLDSKWAEQVGARATRLAAAMQSGEFQ